MQYTIYPSGCLWFLSSYCFADIDWCSLFFILSVVLPPCSVKSIEVKWQKSIINSFHFYQNWEIDCCLYTFLWPGSLLPPSCSLCGDLSSGMKAVSQVFSSECTSVVIQSFWFACVVMVLKEVTWSSHTCWCSQSLMQCIPPSVWCVCM